MSGLDLGKNNNKMYIARGKVEYTGTDAGMLREVVENLFDVVLFLSKTGSKVLHSDRQEV